jgi:hypothetical protein
MNTYNINEQLCMRQKKMSPWPEKMYWLTSFMYVNKKKKKREQAYMIASKGVRIEM